ncbi:S66 peptidase family protein [Chromobacterium sp. IIBBL 290-4]|uniref:S66 family peptidase n=1 Tax=Chromobacterium sp. IIBBL 290-4 TaxID=2953890 RepID=UPI0020B80223|nr:S66 peptidase family protein [Chromobacterium sp. IIBBL 290-4]UTH75900.1 LD-carboxypeptidase [Chromobacterium sp. IIBBL 290-4]
MQIRFPPALKPGDAIAVTAFSSGVHPQLHGQLDQALAVLRARGYRVIEGQCLREEKYDASAPAAARLAELRRFLFDPEIHAILPPWGGERAIELLLGLDFAALAALPPKWLAGFSDVSTVMTPLALLSGWGTLHGPNLMDLPLKERAFGNEALLAAMETGAPPAQESHPQYWKWNEPGKTFANRVRLLDGGAGKMAGRLIGGCLDVLVSLQGSPYFDLTAFKREPAILYLENVELAPCAVLRALAGLRLSGMLDGLSGLILGRSSAQDAADGQALRYEDAVRAALDGLPYPVAIDADIGHVPPQWTLLNGAWAVLEVFGEGRARLSQRLAK